MIEQIQGQIYQPFLSKQYYENRNNEFDPEKFGTIYNQMVTYITEVNTVARGRHTRKQKSKETPIKAEPVES